MATLFDLPRADVGDGISPSDGATLDFFESGTSTRKDTFKNEALTTAHANPVIADGDGLFPEIWLPDGARYKIRLRKKAIAAGESGEQIFESDPVVGSISASSLIKGFDTVVLAAANTEIEIGDIVNTSGYSIKGDGGDNQYEVVATGTGVDDGGSFIDGVTHQLKSIFPGDRFVVKQWGAVADGSTDDTVAVTKAIIYQQANGVLLDFGGLSSSYNLATWTQFGADDEFRMVGNGCKIILPVSISFIKVLNSVDVTGKGTFVGGKRLFENLVTDIGNIDHINICWDYDSVNVGVDVELAFDLVRLFQPLVLNCKGQFFQLGRNVFEEQDNWKKVHLISPVCINLTNDPGSLGTMLLLVNGVQFIASNVTIDGITGDPTTETHGIFTKARFSIINGWTSKGISDTSTPVSSISAINIKGSDRVSTLTPQGFGDVVTDFTIQCEGTSDGIRCRSSDLVVGNGRIDDPLIDAIHMGSDELTSQRILFHDIQIFGTNRAGTTAMRLVADDAPITVSNIDIVGDGFAGRAIRMSCAATSTTGEFLIENVKIKTAGVGYQLFPDVGGTLKKVSIRGGEVIGASIDFRIETGGTTTELIYKDIESDNTVLGSIFSVSSLSGLPAKVDIDTKFQAATSSGTVGTVFSVPIQDTKAYRMEWNVIGIQDTGEDTATYTKMALLRRDGGDAFIEGSVQTPIPDIESGGATAWDADIATGGINIRARVTGEAGKVIVWKGSFKLLSPV